MNAASKPAIPSEHLESVLENALSQSYTAVGDDHRTGTLLNNIAVLYQELGRFGEADTFYKRSLARWERALPKNHTWLAQSLSNRASLYREMEVYPEAERVFQQALAIWRSTEWPSASSWSASLDTYDLATTAWWSERPEFASGHILPRYRASVQAIRKGVQAQDPAAVASFRQTIEKLGPWYHYVDLGHGYSTQAAVRDYPQSRWDALRPFVPEDLSGKSVLDVGCNSGFFAFRMKERNASRVVGIDVMPHVLAQARFLSQWFDYPIELYELGAYDVEQLQSRFDIIVFVGVLYHLKHPLYALEKVANVCDDTMYFQTATTGRCGGEFVPKDNYSASELSVFDDPNFPRLYFMEKSFNGDESNWWFATRGCIKAMARVAGFSSITDTDNSEMFVCRKQKVTADEAGLSIAFKPVPLPQDVEAAKVNEVWGSESAWTAPAIVHWTQHTKVQERINRLASGDPAKNRFEYFMEKYCHGKMPFERAITLGCGHGELERGLARYNFALVHDAVDISEAAIANAIQLAGPAGLKNVHYRIANLNTIDLPKNTYDVVFGISSVHHTSNLEHLFMQVSDGLKPGGYFFLDEFIGPTQFQWTNAQLKAINNALARMPSAYRRCLDASKGTKAPVERYSIEEMNQIDPTEAIRSAEIMPLLPQFFDIVDFRGCGGSVLHLLLHDIAGNFSESDPDSMRYLESLFELEDKLIQSGDLPHDFAVIIAKKKT